MNAYAIHKIFVKVMNCGRFQPAARKPFDFVDNCNLSIKSGEVIRKQVYQQYLIIQITEKWTTG